MPWTPSGPIPPDITGDGPPLVFLHGAWVSSEMWAPQVDRFASDYRVVTIDLPGHGPNKHARTDHHSITQVTTDLHHVLTTYDITNPVLIGLSLGGLVAHTYTTLYPASVRGLVLADTPRSLPPLPYSQFHHPFLYPHHLAYGAISTLGPTRWFRLLVDSIETTIGHDWLALTADAREYAHNEVAKFTASEFTTVYDALVRFTGLTTQSIPIPSLLVNGDHEPPVIRAQTRTLKRSLTAASTTTIPNAGHLSNLDNPGAFNETLTAFLTELGL